jgi:hypothetical protein
MQLGKRVFRSKPKDREIARSGYTLYGNPFEFRFRENAPRRDISLSNPLKLEAISKIGFWLKVKA